MVSPNNKIRVWLVSRPTHHTVQSLIRVLGLSRLPGDRSTPKHTVAHRCTPLPESRRFRFGQLGGQNLGDMLDQKLPNLQSRSKESHKGSFGHALMIGGDESYPDSSSWRMATSQWSVSSGPRGAKINRRRNCRSHQVGDPSQRPSNVYHRWQSIV